MLSLKLDDSAFETVVFFSRTKRLLQGSSAGLPWVRLWDCFELKDLLGLGWQSWADLTPHLCGLRVPWEQALQEQAFILCIINTHVPWAQSQGQRDRSIWDRYREL